ncbi:MAG: TIGR03936 family radical SAM-associated protein [Eubacterium sp.]|nr:TIGR03936 family radical SAM-associated protein [Candidatus Colimonas fimequi]
MAKYVMEFSKTGTICYTSHLDVMRMFKRIFKRAGIPLAYSQGFNPHPKMGFAQPLSLGYEATEEYIEFETQTDWDPNELYERVKAIMADGIDMKYCKPLNENIHKSLSALTEAALYTVSVPLNGQTVDDPQKLADDYLAQEKIITLKKQKKKKEQKEVDIKGMIRRLNFSAKGDTLTMRMLLDQGSTSNLSPELVIATVLPFAGLDTDRSEISVTRDKIIFVDGVEI